METDKIFHKKTDDSRSELFKFINVRPPGSTKSKSKTATIRYDQPRFSKVKNNLFTKLCKLSEIHPKEAKAQLTNLMKGYKSSADFLNSETEIHSVYKGFKEFYDWTVNVKTEKKSTVTNKLESITGQSVTDIVNNDKEHSRTWDAYFHHIIEGTNTQIIQVLTEILRVYAIAHEIAHTKGESINSLERASIVLPECVRVVISITNWVDPVVRKDETAPSAIPDLKKLEEEIKKLQSVKNDIQHTSFLDIEDTFEETDLQKTENDEVLIAEKRWNGFNKTTKEILASGGFDIKNGVMTDMVSYIDNEITKRYQVAFSYIKTSKKFVLIGSSLMEVNDANLLSTKNESSTKSLANQDDEPFDFSTIYGGFWSKAPKDMLLDIQIGDFKRVEQEVKCYVPGEVAHIENILQGELKSRETRRLTRTEETTYYESETTEESERDVQTTDRFEMEKETENVIATDTNITAGLDVSANYGVVKLNASAGFSTNISTENATRQAVEYAKSVTERARNRMVKKIKESRSSTTIREFEDKNIHTIDNTENDNVVGVYRWVDKIYKASLMNYGKRMMIKFHIIEPSRYYKFTQSTNPFAEVHIPESPDKIAENAYRDNNPANNSMVQLNSFKDINEHNYALWAKVYGAVVNPPPKEYIIIGTGLDKQFIKTPAENLINPTLVDQNVGQIKDLVIPSGYKGSKATVRMGLINDGHRHNGQARAHIFVGSSDFYFDANIQNPSTNPQASFGAQTQILSENTDHRLAYNGTNDTLVPVTFQATNCFVLSATISLTCKRSPELFDTWKKETYEAILTAYQNKLTEAEYAKSQIAATAGIQIKGKNPLTNKKIIATELKKHCIDNVRFYTQPLLSHKLNQVPSYIRELDNDEPDITPIDYIPYIQHGRYINAIEECLDWKNMTYELFDYFWGDYKQWTSLINQEDTDPLFENFLKAGSSTVVVPVKPGYEKLFSYHLKTGKLWYGADVPIADELDNYIDDELGDVDPNAEPDCEACWTIKLPTKLTILQKQDGGLDETGLPCFKLTSHCDDDDCGCDE